MANPEHHDPFQDIIDASWQETGKQHVPARDLYSDEWPESLNGRVLKKPSYEIKKYPYWGRTRTCTPPPRIMKRIIEEIAEEKDLYQDIGEIVQNPYVGLKRLVDGSIEIDDNPKTPDGFYDFTDYR